MLKAFFKLPHDLACLFSLVYHILNFLMQGSVMGHELEKETNRTCSDQLRAVFMTIYIKDS